MVRCLQSWINFPADKKYLIAKSFTLVPIYDSTYIALSTYRTGPFSFVNLYDLSVKCKGCKGTITTVNILLWQKMHDSILQHRELSCYEVILMLVCLKFFITITSLCWTTPCARCGGFKYANKEKMQTELMPSSWKRRHWNRRRHSCEYGVFEI